MFQVSEVYTVEKFSSNICFVVAFLLKSAVCMLISSLSRSLEQEAIFHFASNDDVAEITEVKADSFFIEV
jgi:hypothetical protein